MSGIENFSERTSFTEIYENVLSLDKVLLLANEFSLRLRWQLLIRGFSLILGSLISRGRGAGLTLTLFKMIERFFDYFKLIILVL